MLIVDAHLDLSYNAVMRPRDVTRPAAEQPTLDNEIATVGLPDLRAGNVGLVCATIFAAPAQWEKGGGGYTDAQGAYEQAKRHIAWYQQRVADGSMKLVTSRDDLPKPTASRRDTTSAIILMEGADPIRTPDDVKDWYDLGVRIVGLAWKRTRYAGGTGEPGPLTPEGIELVKELDRFGIIHDTSHLAEESFFQLLDLTGGPLIASHSNCRAIVGSGDRHLSDEMIKAIIDRNGVIGINFFDKFLLPEAERGKRRATLDDVLAHVKHICDLAGNANHVGLGTDMDGGLGREQIPVEIQTSADLPRVAEKLSSCGFSNSDVRSVAGESWMRLFAGRLPNV